MDSTIGIGFIGSGFAQKVQAPAFAQIPGCSLLGVASPHNSKTFADKFKMPFYYSDWKELIRNPNIDLLCITSPPVFHYEQAKYALENGKHVLCEKPFTMNVNQTIELYALSLKKNLLALIDHELRFTPGRQYAKMLLNEGKIGPIYFARAESYLSAYRNESIPYNWWFNKEFGGGTWGAIGSHMIDQLRFFVGEIDSAKTFISTSIKSRKDSIGVEHNVTSDDVASSTVRFSNGAIGSVFTTHLAAENKMSVELTGRKGALKLDLDDNVWFCKPGKEWEMLHFDFSHKQKDLFEKYERSEMLKNKFSRAFIFYADAIIESLFSGNINIPDAATFKDGMEIQKVLDSAYGH